MAEFAKIVDGKVETVIVIEPEVLATGRWGDPKNWVQTKEDGSVRGKYAGIGDKYDSMADKFESPASVVAVPLIAGNVTH
jgi:deoxycytidylate deaminase